MCDISLNREKKLVGPDKFYNHITLGLIVVFFLAFLPLLPSASRYRGDERFFTNAAIRMVQTGDYLTPYYYDGRTRFRKPIFVYWVLAASYKIFGVGLLSSRLPFLIAGCLVIWLTYKISLSLFHRGNEALIAAIVIASNFTFFKTSIRSTTDIFQCLFISVSLYGFVNIIFNRDKTSANYVFAYMGAALAIATKGALGIFPVIFSFVFCFFRKSNGIKQKELIDTKIMLISTVVALFWFAAIFYKHGDAAINNFFADQFSERFSLPKLYIVENIFKYLFAPVTEFLPWSFVLLLCFWRDKDITKSFFKEHKEKSLFIFGWYLTLFLVFSGGNIQRTRYLLPAYPLLSVLFSALMMKIINQGRSFKLIRKIHRLILLAGLCGGALLTLVGGFVDLRILAGGIISFFVTLALYVASLRRSLIFGLVTIALFIIMAFSFIDIFIRPVFYISPAPRVVQILLDNRQEKIKIASAGLPHRYVGQIRVISGGLIEIEILPDNVKAEKLEQFPIIILSEKYKERWNPRGYRVEECGHSYKKWKSHYIWNIKKISDLSTLISQMKRRYYLAIRTHFPPKNGGG